MPSLITRATNSPHHDQCLAVRCGARIAGGGIRTSAWQSCWFPGGILFAIVRDSPVVRIEGIADVPLLRLYRNPANLSKMKHSWMKARRYLIPSECSFDDTRLHPFFLAALLAT